ncbi:MAG: glycoside hydrolase family 28 protein [Planctomycetota bacterium]|jgi:polygalacturonase
MSAIEINQIPGIYPVTSYGAVGDGKTVNTGAIQQAIDSCSGDGGGQVLVPSGVYLTGTLYLKDNVELHLQSGSTIKGCTDRALYNADDIYPEVKVNKKEEATGAHLIIGYKVKNISITGTGTIDGNSKEFLGEIPPYENDDSYRAPKGMFPVKDWRPAQMLWLCRCSNISVRDVNLINSTYWTFLLLGCDDVHIRGLSITNPPQTPNGDGIDIDCCKNVTLSDCNIITGDDCITLRADIQTLGEDKVCENVVVSNCVLSTPANGLRVGVGDGTIRNCMFNNIVIADSRVGINMICRFPCPNVRGALIENISFSNFNIDAILALQALHVYRPCMGLTQ